MANLDVQQHLLDAKCLRITYPKPNLNLTPLNGIYEPLDLNPNKDPLEVGEFPLINKPLNFMQTSQNFIGTDNIFALTTNFGKILLQERLKALIVLTNKSKEGLDITLSGLKIKITSEPISNDTFPKQTESQIDIKEDIILKPGQYTTTKLNHLLETIAKYTIEITCYVLIKTKEPQYAKDSYGRINRNSYVYVGKIIKKEFLKKLTFETVLPFKIKESISLNQMNNCRIALSITNQTTMPLNIFNIYLLKDKTSTEKIEPLEKINHFIFQPNEIIELIFNLDNKDIYLNTPSYIANVEWANAFDSITKYFKQLINNTLNIYNEDYRLTLVEAPQGNVYYEQHFKVVFQIENKKDKKIKLDIVIIRDNETNQKEVEIIDIADSSIELKDKANFCLICKSDMLGTVCLPKIKIINTTTNKYKEYNTLLYFNCLEEVKLI
ncbi:MAG: hypothetical protein MJ252_08070 [archaeon]|nr:hypothetical protein [archaeon]